jgi:toxin ParE1/3/4
MPEEYRIILTKRVASDLEKIFDTIAKDSSENASAFVDRILDSIETLKVFPHRNVVDGQDPRAENPVRSLPVQSYLVFFRVLDAQKAVRILRVRHGSRKALKRFE